MDVILSWSGSQSRKVAELLTSWLKDVLPGIKPWISTEDIAKGSAWFPALLGRLEAARLCIICITPQNVRSPWLYFEAGAIAAKGGDARVCSYLIGVEGNQLANGPLGQFQWTVAKKGDTWKLVKDINKHLQSGAYNELLLERNFGQKWPELKQRLDTIVAESKDQPVEEVSGSQVLRPHYQLSREAIRLLLEATSNPHGLVLVLRTMGGIFVKVGATQFVTENDARSAAVWQGAVRQLLQSGLLESRGDTGEVLDVTAEGYRLADEFRAKGVGTTDEQHEDC